MNTRTPTAEALQCPPLAAPAHEPGGGEELVAFLERDQIVADTSRPVSRAHLASDLLAVLWALRVFVVVVSAMVLYTFMQRL